MEINYILPKQAMEALNVFKYENVVQTKKKKCGARYIDILCKSEMIAYSI